MEALLEKIVQNTEPKSSLQIIVSNNKTRFKTRFNPPIQLDKTKQYEIALVNLETYSSFPNIDASNNYFRYSPDDGDLGSKCVYQKEVMKSKIPMIRYSKR